MRTIIPSIPHSQHTLPTIGHLVATVTPAGEILSVFRNADGALVLNFPSPESASEGGFEFDRHDLPVVIALLESLRCLLEGGEA